MNFVRPLPNKSSTTLAAKDGYLVKFDTDGVNVCAAITDPIVGLIKTGGASGENSDILMHGEGLALLGGTVVAGQRIGPHTDGTVVASAGSGNQDCGVALEGGIAGDRVNVFITLSNKTFA